MQRGQLTVLLLFLYIAKGRTHDDNIASEEAN